MPFAPISFSILHSIFPYAQWFCISSLVPNCLLLLGYPLYGLPDIQSFFT